MTINLAESHPCPERCPQCREKCWGSVGHTSSKTAPRQFATLHQCRRHVWGTLAEKAECERSQYRETQREFDEACSEAAKRIRKAVFAKREVTNV